MTSRNESVKSLRDLSLKELKEKAVNLGIRGTTSRTKYTKRNRGKLIDDIVYMDGLKDQMKSNKLSENVVFKDIVKSVSFDTNNDSEKTIKEVNPKGVVERDLEDLSRPKFFKSIKEEKEHQKEAINTPEDSTNFATWIIGGILAVTGITLSVLASKVFPTQNKQKHQIKFPSNVIPIQNIINDI